MDEAAGSIPVTSTNSPQFIEYEIVRLCFAKPFPPKLNVKTELSVKIFFATPPFGNNIKGSMIDINVLQDMCKDVDLTADRFKKL